MLYADHALMAFVGVLEGSLSQSLRYNNSAATEDQTSGKGQFVLDSLEGLQFWCTGPSVAVYMSLH